MGREARDVLSYRCDQADLSQTAYSTTKGTAQQGYFALTARRPFPSHSTMDVSAPTAPNCDSPAFPLVIGLVEPPPESNRRPHPYHGSAAKRRAIRHLRRSLSTVGAVVIGPLWRALERLSTSIRSASVNHPNKGMARSPDADNMRAREGAMRRWAACGSRPCLLVTAPCVRCPPIGDQGES